ncbi:MAG: hypothetical protein JRI38_02340 [Deltaproteobacteria bacterium]|nr:hypothetical protein [Deltaproteobacteria bacterium]
MTNKKETIIKKTAKPKTESRFYIARTVLEIRETIKDKVDTYKEKYIKNQLKTGREFITEFKDDPMKRLDDSIDDGKEFIKDFKTDSRKKYETFIDDGKEAMKKVKKGPFKAAGKVIDNVKTGTRERMEKAGQTRKKIYRGIEGDARLVMDDMVNMGKKTLDKLPMKKNIENKINSSIISIPSRLNLPGKEEIKNLMSGIDGMNKKVDELNKISAYFG